AARPTEMTIAGAAKRRKLQVMVAVPGRGRREKGRCYGSSARIFQVFPQPYAPGPQAHGRSTMKLNPLGRTGLFVSELCLGTMTFGGGDEGMWGKIGRLQQGDAERIVGAAIDGGINFIDTADVYAGGR